MARVKRSVHAKKKRREILEAAKGYTGVRRKRYRDGQGTGACTPACTPTATAATARRSSAACGSPGSTRPCRPHGISYSGSSHGLKAAGVELDRKILADMAVHDPAAFAALVETAKAARPVA